MKKTPSIKELLKRQRALEKYLIVLIKSKKAIKKLNINKLNAN